ncbi:hypothetical protein [Schleiferilactobacillus shenzhenensis]|nr:hypothetical protein [Schleiferilactobacillus shenzhenensis]
MMKRFTALATTISSAFVIGGSVGISLTATTVKSFSTLAADAWGYFTASRGIWLQMTGHVVHGKKGVTVYYASYSYGYQ